MPKAAVIVTKGSPREYWSVSDQGNRVARYFCAECGTPLFAQSAANQEMIAIKPGSLDDPSWFRPTANIWVSSVQPWAFIDPSLPKFEKNPG
jgi:hypothetical protein